MLTIQIINLTRAKFNQMEVELFLERYELNQNIYLDDEETNAIIDGLEKGETAAEMRAHRVSTSKGHEKIELPTQEMDGYTIFEKYLTFN